MTLTAFLAYSIALAIAAAIPGPGIAALVGRALGTGTRRTLPMLVGLATGDVIYLALAVAGLAFVAHTFSGVFFVIKIAGAAYLLWLAFKFWTSGIDVQEVQKSPGRRDGVTAFVGGLAVTLGNPKTIVFYMAIVPAVMDLRQVDATAFGVLALLTYLILFVVLMPYVALADRARIVFKSPKALKRLNRFAAAAMTGTAAWIVARS